ncbi:MAG: DsrE family protein [Anaerolineae bacterium]|nr:DsrE family protein [Anaerolineae bacterium]
MAEKLVILVTHGPSDPEMATIPFVMATAAQASDVEVSMAFQSDGVWLMMKDLAWRVHVQDFPPMKELMDAYLEAGGKMYVCGPCVKSRKITADDMVEGAQVVNAATLVVEIAAATNTLVY